MRNAAFAAVGKNNPPRIDQPFPAVGANEAGAASYQNRHALSLKKVFENRVRLQHQAQVSQTIEPAGDAMA